MPERKGALPPLGRLSKTPRVPKNHSIQSALLAAGERENRPSKRIAGGSKRSANPAQSTLKRDSEVTRKLAALPRPLKPPGQT